MTYYIYKDTPGGTLLLVGDDKILGGIYWKVFNRVPKIKKEWVQDEKIFKKHLKQLDEYFEGGRKSFDLVTKAEGTDFQKKVWKEISQIPYGTTRSYKEIAEAVGKPKAVRAVGTAVGSNPLCVAVPCHRVLTSSGKLGGYAGGIKAKKLLLEREGIKLGSK